MSKEKKTNGYIKIILILLMFFMIKAMFNGTPEVNIKTETPVATETTATTNEPVKTETPVNTETTATTNEPIKTASTENPQIGNVQKLTASGPITVTHDGQVIEGLNITSKSGAAITIKGFKNVVINNCKITAYHGPGISAANADGLKIQNVDIINGSASVGLKPNASADENNISVSQTKGLTIYNARLTGGSSGIYVDNNSGNVNISNIEGYNFKGPMPRGQLVQLAHVNTGTINGFYCKNDPNNSYPEDNISLFMSQNITVKNGLIDGNNSITGCGVMAESGSSNCLIENVDALNQGNGSFVSWGASNVTFKNVRTKDNHATSVRGANASGSLIFASSSGATGTSFINAIYFNPANPDNISLNYKAPMPMVVKDIKKQDFTTRTPLKLKFGWE